MRLILGICVTLLACGRIGYEPLPEVDEGEIPGEEDRDEDVCLAARFGDGKEGSVRIETGTQRILNASTRIQEGLAAGADTVPFADIPDLAVTSALRAGSVVLFWQTQLAVEVSRGGNHEARDPSQAPRFGYHETRRVAEVAEGHIRLCAPLSAEYAPGAQMVVVPQYASLEVEPDAVVIADGWNGAHGGMVALMVQGALTVDGRISSSGLGFRGGEYRDRGAGEIDCESQDYGHVGEGFGAGFGETVLGTPNYGSGGGAAICANDGGAGGGGWAKGGRGGRKEGGSNALSQGGQGVASPAGYLALGGGGGAGSGNQNAGTGGAPGGGVTWIRAARIEGLGNISASGGASMPGNRNGGRDGSGGGGGGGTIDLFTSELAFLCSGFSARGGAAAAAASTIGAGGGGGGGLVRFAGELQVAPDCGPRIDGGPRGNTHNASPGPEDGMPGHFAVTPWREVPQATAP